MWEEGQASGGQKGKTSSGFGPEERVEWVIGGRKGGGCWGVRASVERCMFETRRAERFVKPLSVALKLGSACD